MSVDINEGDLLVVGSASYPVKAVSDWAMTRQSAKSFARLAVVPVSRKRAANSGGKIIPASSDAAPLTGLYSTPIDPLSGGAAVNAQQVFGLDKPTQYLEAFITDGTSFVDVILERKK